MTDERSMTTVFIGDFSVGKTSIFMRIAENIFNIETPTTIGVDYRIVSRMLDDKKVKIRMWDTAGMERFRSLVGCYLSGVDVIFMVCDVTDEESWVNLEKVWYRYMKRTPNFNDNTLLYILVNKWDIRRSVDRLKNMDDPCRMKYIKEKIGSIIPYRKISFVSAKDGKDIETTLKFALRDFYNVIRDRLEPNLFIIEEQREKEENMDCCSQCMSQ